MFPEGTRNREGRLRPGLPGAGSLGLEPGVTVVPAAVWGSQERFGPIRVVFGPPLDLSDLGDGAQRALAGRRGADDGRDRGAPAAGGRADWSPGQPRATDAPPEVVDG